MNRLDQLNRLNELLEKGKINESEYQKLKNEILSDNVKNETSIQARKVGLKQTRSKRVALSIIGIITLLAAAFYFLIYYKNNGRSEYDEFPLNTEIPTGIMRKIHLNLISNKELSLFDLKNKITDTAALNTFYAKFYDLDNDGAREMLSGYNNGGNAAIQTNSLFVRGNNEVFKQLFTYNGGIEFANEKIKFYFNSLSKYFHTCGSCTIWLPNDFITTFTLGYKSKNLYYISDQSVNEIIIQNLNYLKRKGNYTVNFTGDDNGLRKAFLENIIIFYFNNKADFDISQKLFFDNYEAADGKDIWREIKKLITDIKKNFIISDSQYSVGLDKERSLPTKPEEIFMEFKKAVQKNGYSEAQKYIHSEGVYYFSCGRIAKNDFAFSKLSKLKGCFNSYGSYSEDVEIPKDNTTGEKKIDYLYIDGIMLVEDNFMNAAGFDVAMESPHFSKNWRKDGGYFRKGSKIISVNPHPNENKERLLIELYPEEGQWRIFSIGKWFWSP